MLTVRISSVMIIFSPVLFFIVSIVTNISILITNSADQPVDI